MPRADALVVDHRTLGDPVNPSAEGLSVAKLSETTVNADEHLLDDIVDVTRRRNAARDVGAEASLELRPRAACFAGDHAGTAQVAHHAGGGDAQARLCELFQGVVALFAAGRGRRGL